VCIQAKPSVIISKTAGAGHGIPAIDSIMTLREAGPLWLESRKLFISAVTYRDYSIYVKTLAGFFGELVLAKIGGDLTTTKGNWAQVGNEIGNQSGVVHEARSRGNSGRYAGWGVRRAQGGPLFDRELEGGQWGRGRDARGHRTPPARDCLGLCQMTARPLMVR